MSIVLVGVISGHCMIGSAECMGNTANDLCKICLDEVELFSLLPCRLQCLVSCNFHNLECMNDVPLISLLRSMKKWWFR